MSDESAVVREPSRKLSDAVRDVKNAAADRSDVVVDIRDAEKMRLELLATELAPVFEDVPREIESFDFALSSGLQPRLWIDAVSHVTMGRDKRTYRFVQDTRVGRIVLAESSEMKPVADQVTRYVAERMVERERMLDGHAELPKARVSEERVEPVATAAAFGWPRFLTGLYLVASGALLAVFATFVFLLWDKRDVIFGLIPG